MQASQACLDFIKKQEGLSLHAYKDGAGVPTIGWGTIRYDDGSKVKMGDTCTQDQAQHWLEREVHQVDAAIDSAVKVPLTQAEHDALCSWGYNVGTGWITGIDHQQATLIKLLNKGNYNAVPGQLLLFERDVSGKIEPGLQTRRKWEAQMWLQGENDHTPVVAAAPTNQPGQMPQTVTPSPQPKEAIMADASTTQTAPSAPSAASVATDLVTLAKTSFSTLWTGIAGLFGSTAAGTIITILASSLPAGVMAYILAALGIAGTVTGAVASVYHIIAHVSATNNATIALAEKTINQVQSWLGAPQTDFSAANG